MRASKPKKSKPGKHIKAYYHSDNVRVPATKGEQDHSEFFAVHLSELTDVESPQTASINRYAVPGRYDHYDFDYALCRVSRDR